MGKGGCASFKVVFVMIFFSKSNNTAKKLILEIDDDFLPEISTETNYRKYLNLFRMPILFEKFWLHQQRGPSSFKHPKPENIIVMVKDTNNLL